MIEESNPGPLDPRLRAAIGRHLSDRRKLAGLTGSQLARRVRMSQSRISRIENGLAPVTFDEVRSLAAALDLSAGEVRRLLAPADGATGPPAMGHLNAADIAERQNEIQRIESSTKEVRAFTPAAVAGLLQTSEYARASLTALYTMEADDGGGIGDDEVLRSVATRLDRQRVLADSDRRFHFVMQEAVLQNRFCQPAQMLAQIQRVKEVRDRENVTVAVVSIDAQWPHAAPNFTVYDDSHVLIDLPHAVVVLTNPGDIGLYRRMFDKLVENSTTDIDPILDRYVDMYYELARPRRD
jgi:transcriptional regulator with XRE-family HTH domain